MDGYGKRVLIIDDNEDNLYLTGGALMDRGYNVYQASDGLEGSEHMKKRRYDVVLVDYHMPRLNGLQFIETCRVMWPETPIILMSADSSVTDRPDLVKGVFGCVTKPFALTHLIALVNQACRNSPLRRIGPTARRPYDRSTIFPVKGAYSRQRFHVQKTLPWSFNCKMYG